jgi:hypothetical protein
MEDFRISHGRFLETNFDQIKEHSDKFLTELSETTYGVGIYSLAMAMAYLIVQGYPKEKSDNVVDQIEVILRAMAMTLKASGLEHSTEKVH